MEIHDEEKGRFFLRSALFPRRRSCPAPPPPRMTCSALLFLHRSSLLLSAVSDPPCHGRLSSSLARRDQRPDGGRAGTPAPTAQAAAEYELQNQTSSSSSSN